MIREQIRNLEDWKIYYDKLYIKTGKQKYQDKSRKFANVINEICKKNLSSSTKNFEEKVKDLEGRRKSYAKEAQKIALSNLTNKEFVEEIKNLRKKFKQEDETNSREDRKKFVEELKNHRPYHIAEELREFIKTEVKNKSKDMDVS